MLVMNKTLHQNRTGSEISFLSACCETRHVWLPTLSFYVLGSVNPQCDEWWNIAINLAGWVLRESALQNQDQPCPRAEDSLRIECLDDAIMRMCTIIHWYSLMFCGVYDMILHLRLLTPWKQSLRWLQNRTMCMSNCFYWYDFHLIFLTLHYILNQEAPSNAYWYWRYRIRK